MIDSIVPDGAAPVKSLDELRHERDTAEAHLNLVTDVEQAAWVAYEPVCWENRTPEAAELKATWEAAANAWEQARNARDAAQAAYVAAGGVD